MRRREHKKRDPSRSGPSFVPANTVPHRTVAVRNMGYNAGRAGQEPNSLLADDPAYMDSYRLGRASRTPRA